MPAPQLSIVVTTYQMPGHLRRCLESIRRQRTQRRLEVIVADDGSQDETPRVVGEFAGQAPFPVRFVTHEHCGFHPARSRNDGVRQATAPHLLFVDGDCVLPPDHVEAHLSAWRPATVTSGYCVRLTEQASREVSLESIERGDFQRLATADELHKLAAMHRKAWWYSLIGHATKPTLRSTDFSIARTDYERVNGFDQRYCGWGCEDDDLGRRLAAAGVRLVSVLDRTRVYHLWHPPAPSKSAEWRDGANVAYLKRPLRLTRCLAGLTSRTGRDLTVRLAGEPRDAAALSCLISQHGWQIECDGNRRADLELLPWTGRGRFRRQGDVRVLAILDDTARLPWAGRRAQLVLSPSGKAGRADQIRLRLADSAGLWQALLTSPNQPAEHDHVRQFPAAVPCLSRPVAADSIPRSLTISST